MTISATIKPLENKLIISAIDAYMHRNSFERSGDTYISRTSVNTGLGGYNHSRVVTMTALGPMLKEVGFAQGFQTMEKRRRSTRINTVKSLITFDLAFVMQSASFIQFESIKYLMKHANRWSI